MYLGYEGELLEKAWKDAAYGAVLLVDPVMEGIPQLLEEAGVAESPLEWVPKQKPDHIILAKGRATTRPLARLVWHTFAGRPDDGHATTATVGQWPDAAVGEQMDG